MDIGIDLKAARVRLEWEGGRFGIALNPEGPLCGFGALGAGAGAALAGAGAALAGPGPRWSVLSAGGQGALEILLEARAAGLTAAIRVEPVGRMLLWQPALHRAAYGPPALIGAAESLCLATTATGADAIAGAWAHEGQPRRLAAPLAIGSTTGRTGFDWQNWLALEEEGGVAVAQLLWSGSWRMALQGGELRAGLHPGALHHALAEWETLALPPVLIGRGADAGDAARMLHDARRRLRPDARPVAVQFNTWFPYPGAPDATRLEAMIPLAAGLGCEVFVLDAGWFNSCEALHPDDWWAAVGEWSTNLCAFPFGLRPLAEACRAHGMGFGLWFEPEAVGTAAPVRRQHPDWLHWPGGQPPRGRAVLNLGVPAARDYAFAAMAGMISRTGAVWLKWDNNADIAPGWAPGLGEGTDAGVAHVEGLYALMDRLRAAFPGLTVEMCASGGARMDAGVLARAHTFWISDQPRALAKLRMHLGLWRAHPPEQCNDWLVDWPPGAVPAANQEPPAPDRRGDLLFRLHVAMLGGFGLSAPLHLWDDDELALARRMVALYRGTLRGMIAEGAQHVLAGGEDGWAALAYVAGGRAALFAFRLEGAERRGFAVPGFAPVEIALPAPYRSELRLLERA